MAIKQQTSVLTRFADTSKITDEATRKVLEDVYAQLVKISRDAYEDIKNLNSAKADGTTPGVAVTSATGLGDVVAQLNALLASLRTTELIDT